MSYQKPLFEVADIARNCASQLSTHYNITAQQKKVLTNMIQCRTAQLGGHKEECDNKRCRHERFAYNGCRDRHCTKCNALKREKWVANRKADALPVPYFHVVFTIPDSLEALCLSKPKEMYKLLFKTAWDTISFFAKDHKHLGAKPGMIALLHTWGQNMARHTHLHCLVPAGGITEQHKWRKCKREGKFFVHVKKLSSVFRGKFTDGLIDLQNNRIIHLEQELKKDFKHLHPLYNKKWVVYAKKPMPTSDKVVEYIGRYSHSVAISNHRIKEVKDGKVTFSWIDYRTSKPGLMTLSEMEFLHRFVLHVLPVGFVKIRHYGILATRNKTSCIEKVRSLFGVPLIPKPEKKSWSELFELSYGRSPKLCPCCKTGLMVVVETYKNQTKYKARDGPAMEPNYNFYKQKN